MNVLISLTLFGTFYTLLNGNPIQRNGNLAQRNVSSINLSSAKLTSLIRHVGLSALTNIKQFIYIAFHATFGCSVCFIWWIVVQWLGTALSAMVLIKSVDLLQSTLVFIAIYKYRLTNCFISRLESEHSCEVNEYQVIYYCSQMVSQTHVVLHGYATLNGHFSSPIAQHILCFPYWTRYCDTQQHYIFGL